MRKIVTALALGACLALSSCLAGPHQVRRSVDDWDHEMYVNSPWVNGVLWVVPVFPFCYIGAIVTDLFLVDAYSFWFEDAWDGMGTGFQHYEVTPTDGVFKSFLLDDGVLLEKWDAIQMDGGVLREGG